MKPTPFPEKVGANANRCSRPLWIRYWVRRALASYQPPTYTPLMSFALPSGSSPLSWISCLIAQCVVP